MPRDSVELELDEKHFHGRLKDVAQNEWFGMVQHLLSMGVRDSCPATCWNARAYGGLETHPSIRIRIETSHARRLAISYSPKGRPHASPIVRSLYIDRNNLLPTKTQR
ncbi:unnamed protein product [Periconia digitata]|uniref:Uncharacterized protein n=1 Tax=Periconia digitata TaxID=1303443 RepID=A0A9W4XGG0_9PLEO|nr:unnamed protein product [Periconia digitata]